MFPGIGSSIGGWLPESLRQKMRSVIDKNAAWIFQQQSQLKNSADPDIALKFLQEAARQKAPGSGCSAEELIFATLAGLKDSLDNDLSAAGSNPQAVLETQQKMQKMQQTFQTLSNIMKAQHDMQMSVIRNIK